MEESSHNSRIKKRPGQKYSAAEKKRAKALYLEALVKFGGLKTPAYKSAGNLTHDTVKAWREQDPVFAAAEEAAVTQGCEQFGDMVEAKLYDRASQGDTTAIIFALKTKYKQRGYTERTEIAADLAVKGFQVVVQDARAAEELEKLKGGE